MDSSTGMSSPTDTFAYIDPYSGSNLPMEPSGLAAAIVSKRFVTLRWNPDDTQRTTGYSVFWREQSSLRWGHRWRIETKKWAGHM